MHSNDAFRMWSSLCDRFGQSIETMRIAKRRMAKRIQKLKTDKISMM